MHSWSMGPRIGFFQDFPLSPGDSHGGHFKTREQGYVEKIVSVAQSLARFLGVSANMRNFLKRTEIQVKSGTGFVSSFIDIDDVNAVVEHTTKLNQIIPPDLPVLNTTEMIAEIAGVSDGTYIGGSAQLDKLQAAQDLRDANIAKLEAARNSLQDLEDEYEQTVDAARKVEEAVGKQVGDPILEIATLVKGYSFSISWFDFYNEFLPALVARAEAAKKARQRLETAISLARADREGFQRSRQEIDRLWEPPAVIAGDVVLRKLRQDMEDGTRAALELAKSFRDEAKSIREHNERISKIQQFVNVIGSAASLANAAGSSGDSSAKGLPDVKPSKEKTTFVIFDRTTGSWMMKRREITIPKTP